MDLTTGIGRIPLALLSHAEKLGLDRGEVLRSAGLHEETLRDPDARIPASKIEKMWRAMISRAPHSALGVEMGASFTIREWGLVGYSIAYSGTLLQALQRLVRYSRIMSEAIRFKLRVGKDRSSLVVDGGPRFDSLQHPVVARLVSILGAMREVAGVDIIPLEVRLPFNRPASVSEYARCFRCPLAFDQRDAAIVLRKDDLERSLSFADDTLSGYLDHLADEVLEALGGDHSFSEKTRRAIWSELSDGQPSVQRSARVLGVSVRTLQRRLKDEGTSFAAVLESFRREMAAGLLRSRDLAIYEVAFLLGYSEPSTFYRAFRRWHGTTPREFRRSLTETL